MKPGDRCRSTSGAPGVYIGGGLCLCLDAQYNWRTVSPAREAEDHDFPVPTTDEVESACRAVNLIMRTLVLAMEAKR